jgi:N-acetylmuramoyl-L-alanine amidase
MLYAKDGIQLINESTYVPVRALSKALGATVTWDSTSKRVSLYKGNGTILPGDAYYNEDALYWLSRIIHAESSGEPIQGKIAVGNVILNRVKSPDFPDSIYDVIFDHKWGIQFEPIQNGTIYEDPGEESILAAKLCLDGASVVGNSLYFLNPVKADSLWIMNNLTYVETIGNHCFYAE